MATYAPPTRSCRSGSSGALASALLNCSIAFSHVARLLEEQAALERQARVVLVDRGDLVELRRRASSNLRMLPEGDAEPEVRRDVLRVLREGRLVVAMAAS